MASIATVVTRGFGSFGGAGLLPTLGYGVGGLDEPGCLHISDAAVWSIAASDAVIHQVTVTDAAVWAVSPTDRTC